MPAVAARLIRILPLIVALGVLAAVVYLVVAWRSSPARAKQILIRAFTWIGAAIAVFFALAALYAALERNWTAVEIALSFGAVGLVALLIARICNRRFAKRNPRFAISDTVQAEVIDPPLWQRLLRRVLEDIAANFTGTGKRR